MTDGDRLRLDEAKSHLNDRGGRLASRAGGLFQTDGTHDPCAAEEGGPADLVVKVDAGSRGDEAVGVGPLTKFFLELLALVDEQLTVVGD